MILRQFLHRDPVAISYVPGCGNATSTIGFEKRNNRALRIKAKEEFIKMMVAEIPSPPPEAAWMRAINSGQQVTAA